MIRFSPKELEEGFDCFNVPVSRFYEIWYSLRTNIAKLDLQSRKMDLVLIRNTFGLENAMFWEDVSITILPDLKLAILVLNKDETLEVQVFKIIQGSRNLKIIRRRALSSEITSGITSVKVFYSKCNNFGLIFLAGIDGELIAYNFIQNKLFCLHPSFQTIQNIRQKTQTKREIAQLFLVKQWSWLYLASYDHRVYSFNVYSLKDK